MFRGDWVRESYPFPMPPEDMSLGLPFVLYFGQSDTLTTCDSELEGAGPLPVSQVPFFLSVVGQAPGLSCNAELQALWRPCGGFPLSPLSQRDLGAGDLSSQTSVSP
jgi:hypothetical protein